MARRLGMEYLSLDVRATRQKALEDPESLIKPEKSYVIDEIQYGPELIFAIKRAVDIDPTPGRFLITGSLEPFLTGLAPDSMAGRLTTIQMFPLSKGEQLCCTNPLFTLECLFSRGKLSIHSIPPAALSAELSAVDHVMRGGYPESLMTDQPTIRKAWLEKYAYALVSQEILKTHNLTQADKMPRLMEMAAQMTGQLFVPATLANHLSLSPRVIEEWVTLLEHLFLLRLVHPLPGAKLASWGKASKLHFVDTALAAALQGLSLKSINESHDSWGHLFESMIGAELHGLISLTYGEYKLYHYKSGSKLEVDFVLRRDPGDLVGIEVKAAKSLNQNDFKGLRQLREWHSKNWVRGIVLYQGEDIVTIEDDLTGMPYQMLWRSHEWAS